MIDFTSRFQVVSDVIAERGRQDEQWGEQNHPDGTGPNSRPLYGFDAFIDEADSASDLAVKFKQMTDKRFSGNSHVPGSWRDILLEEIFEAMAEDDPEKLVAELIQSAAVIVAWIEAIRRRNA